MGLPQWDRLISPHLSALQPHMQVCMWSSLLAPVSVVPARGSRSTVLASYARMWRFSAPVRFSVVQCLGTVRWGQPSLAKCGFLNEVMGCLYCSICIVWNLYFCINLIVLSIGVFNHCCFCPACFVLVYGSGLFNVQTSYLLQTVKQLKTKAMVN